jgi:hypothetical protein
VLESSVGLPLDTPGTWTLQIDAVTTVGVLDSAEVTFALSDSSGAFPTVPPAGTTQPGAVVEEIVPSTTAAPFATTTIAPTTTTTTTPDG